MKKELRPTHDDVSCDICGRTILKGERTEAYLAQMAYIEILMVGTGLRRGPPALRQLKRVRQVLQERGVDSETHPVLERAWSKGEVQPS